MIQLDREKLRAVTTRLMKLDVLLPFALLAAGALGVTLLFGLRPAPESVQPEEIAPLIRVQTMTREPVRFVVRTQGAVAPRSESALVPQVAGEVVWVSPSLASGGFFERGEPLLRIDRADAAASVTRAEAALARARSEASRAQKERARQEQLAARGVTSEARMDDAKNGESIARAALAEAEVALEKAQRDLSRTELRAPYAGRVRNKNVDVGQFVKRGDAVARIYAVDFAEVRLPVPDRELGFLNVSLNYRPRRGDGDGATTTTSAQQKPARADAGPPVRLSANFAGAEHHWQGRIVRTEGEIDPKSRMVTLVAQVENPYAEHAGRPPLAVGLFVNAEIEGAEVADAFLLPRVALREGGRVLVLEGERLQFREVRVLRVEREHVVVGAGLREGERVCVTPLAQATPGMRVRVAPDTSDATPASPPTDAPAAPAAPNESERRVLARDEGGEGGA